MYAIRSFLHRNDLTMSAHGFCVDLHPRVKDAVLKSNITQESIERMLNNVGQFWLDGCGWGAMFDPENCGFDADKDAEPGPKARKMYQPNQDLRVTWGEWGPEHITVPGNACGLDIDRSSFNCVFKDGARLLPHNVDGWSQKYLLTIVVTEIFESLILCDET